MDLITYILICHFGLEKVLKNEVRKLGLEISEVTDGEVKVKGKISDIPRLNFNLRTAERVMIEINTFKAVEPDDLLYGSMESEIEKYVPRDGEFLVTKANQDKNSVLRSAMANQKTVKKAFVERLKKVYKTDYLPESKGSYPFRVKFNKNICSIRLDTTGESLHKRGYRLKGGIAPIEETLAAALIKLTEFRKDSILIDPFCGSGTIPIEAALIACNLPSGIDRKFVSESWDIIPKSAWEDARDEAKSFINEERLKSKDIKIYGFDIDSEAIKVAKENAKRAKVDKLIHFERCEVKKFAELELVKKLDVSLVDRKGIILTNPPYGERLEDKKTIYPIYKDLKLSYDKLKNFDMHIITSYEDMKKIYGTETKNRKLYNGMIKTYFYSYNKN